MHLAPQNLDFASGGVELWPNEHIVSGNTFNPARAVVAVFHSQLRLITAPSYISTSASASGCACEAVPRTGSDAQSSVIGRASQGCADNANQRWNFAFATPTAFEAHRNNQPWLKHFLYE